MIPEMQTRLASQGRLVGQQESSLTELHNAVALLAHPFSELGSRVAHLGGRGIPRLCGQFICCTGVALFLTRNLLSPSCFCKRFSEQAIQPIHLIVTKHWV